MKKFMILIAAMAMTTLAAQAESIGILDTTVAVMETAAPTTDTDTNGTEEAAPEGI